MSFLNRIREFIGGLHHGDVQIELTVEVKRATFRRMTPEEKAATLAQAWSDWKRDNNGEELDYRHSIVDFMKLTRQDWSLEHRRELAAELSWDGNVSDTSAMNQFLLPKLRERLEIAI